MLNADELLRNWPCKFVPHELAGGGRWVLCRPLRDGSLRARLRDAWVVFTMKADAIAWTGQ
jgi:hypothetical protein